MKDSVMKIGFWASLLQSIVGYLYLIMYIIFIVNYPPKPWTSIEDFALLFHGNYKVLLITIQLLAFMQSFLFFIIMVVINNKVSDGRKLVTNIGVYCSVIFLALSSIHYYIQWTSVSIGISNKMLSGLEQLVQFNFDSPISVINILGWTLFFGISNITLAFCFEKQSIGKLLNWGFLINGISCVITSILFAFGVKSIMLIWTAFLTITWYTYPILTVLFRNGKIKLS